VSVSGLYRPKLGAYHASPSGEGAPRRLRAIAGLLFLVLVAEAVYIPLFSPRFAVREIELRGDARVAEQVAGAIHLPANTNLLRAPTALVKRQAERVTAVREARVTRAPWRRLVVTLERREAMAVIRGAKRAVFVDPTGVTFTVRDEWGWGLPELAAPRLSKGDTESAEARAEVAQLLGALRALGPDPRLRIARLSMDRLGWMEAELDSGARVRLGANEQLPTKAKLLAMVVDQLGSGKIELLDLTDPWAAYWRPRQERKPKG
jgi:cell division septal protein FtsQ